MFTRECLSHGRLMDPPARNAMWRFGYPNPVNYNDNELFCGGYAGKMIQYDNVNKELAHGAVARALVLQPQDFRFPFSSV